MLNVGVEICLTDIYEPNSDAERNALWVELEDNKSWGNAIWCISGDFNVVRLPLERKGRGAFMRLMEDFSTL